MSDKLVIAGEMFDAFYKEQTDNGTADGSIWEYKDDIEKLMIEYHNSQLEPLKEHIKNVVEYNLSHEVSFLEKTINEIHPVQNVQLTGMKSTDLLNLVETEYPEYKSWVVYNLLVLDTKLNS